MDNTPNIGFLLMHLAFVLGHQNDQILQEQLGIGFSQFKLMMVLQATAHIQQRQIASALSQTEASISRQIKLLQEKGLLQTLRNPKNRRQHLTTLTAKGERFAIEARQVLNDYHQAMFDQLSDKQRQQLAEALGVMHQFACRGKDMTCQRFVSNN